MKDWTTLNFSGKVVASSTCIRRKVKEYTHRPNLHKRKELLTMPSESPLAGIVHANIHVSIQRLRERHCLWATGYQSSQLIDPFCTGW